MRSILLGVMAFIIVPKNRKATTNQIPMFEIVFNCGNSKSARDKTSTAIKHNTIILNMATTLIFGGYLPGYFPPMEAAPHGAPAAKHA